MLIPANQLDRAKGRLASLLEEPERVQLFMTTLRTVVAAAEAAGLDTAVLTADRRIAAALGPGLRLLDEDPAREGLNGQLEGALERLGLGYVLILHADLPLASGPAIRAVVEAAPAAPSATMVRSRDGGTNAMLLRPPGRFELGYGRRSFERHRAAAVAAGMAVAEVTSPELGLDLDTVDDCWALLETEAGRASPAGELLQSFALKERLVTDL